MVEGLARRRREERIVVIRLRRWWWRAMGNLDVVSVDGGMELELQRNRKNRYSARAEI